MPVTMKQIAQYASVSTATVSKILNGQDRYISQATRQRVLDLVQQHGYRPNALAKGLKMKRTSTLGLIVPDLAAPYYAALARGVEDMAREKEFAVLICSTDGDEGREEWAATFLQSKMVDGLIFAGPTRSALLERYRSGPVPAVAVESEEELAGETLGQVGADVAAAVREATMLLLDKGCGRIGFVAADSGRAAYEGYRGALESRGVDFDREMASAGADSAQAGYQAALAILDRGVNGMVCGSEPIAMGVLRAAAERGRAVPKDLKVAALTCAGLADYTTPPVTGVELPAADLGRGAAELLCDHVLTGRPMERRTLEFHLIRRASV